MPTASTSRLSVEGTVVDADTGDPVPLDGVSVDGDVDIAGEAAQVTFSLPMLFGMAGEVIVIGEDLYLLPPMAGDQWLHLPASPEEKRPIPPSEPPTDQEIADKVTEFVTTDGVGVSLLADQACGDDTCYHLQVSDLGRSHRRPPR